MNMLFLLQQWTCFCHSPQLRGSNSERVVFAPTVDMFLPQSTTWLCLRTKRDSRPICTYFYHSFCSAESFRNYVPLSKTILLAPGGHHYCGSHLLGVCVDHSRIIPYRPDLLLQQSFILTRKSYHLYAWRFSCSTTF